MREFDRKTTSDIESIIMSNLDSIRHLDMSDEALEHEITKSTPTFPLKIQIQTSTRCNAACAMCPYPEITGEPGFVHKLMDESLYLNILEQLKGRNVQRLALFLMNEPLLDKRLPDWIKLAGEYIPQTEISLFSNGSALTEKMLYRLAASGLKELNISVHGFNPTIYERVMKKLKYERTINNVKRAINAHNNDELNGMRLQLVTGDLDEINQDNAPPELLPFINHKAFSNERSASETTPDLPSSEISNKVYERPICQRPFVKLYILTSGECVLCNVDWRKTEVLGNLKTGKSIEDIWNGARYKQVRRNHIRRKWADDHICQRCDYPLVVNK